MQILIISGFLGAGKTTFIKELAKKTKRDFCILENEFGSINLDKEFLNENKNKDLSIYELTQGCICCSSKGEFASSVLTIANTIDPDYLIIEPTGVGILSNIIKNLNKVVYERISILPPITIVDGISLINSNFYIDNLLKDQISNAKYIVVSKSENLTKNEKQKIEKVLQKLNINAKIIVDHYSNLSSSNFFVFLKNENFKSINNSIDVDTPDYSEFSLQDFYFKSEIELIIFLEDLTRNEFGNIIRAKGIIKFKNHNLSINVSNKQYIITGYDNMIDNSKIVFIGNEINKNKIRKSLNIL